MTDKTLFVARPTEARALYESHVDHYRRMLDTDFDVAAQRFGFMYFHSLQPEERIELSKKLGILRGDAIDEYNLGTVAFQEKRYDEARHHLDKALKLKPDFFEATYQLAVLHEETGNVPKARQFAQKALDLAPEDEVDFVEEQMASIGKAGADTKD